VVGNDVRYCTKSWENKNIDFWVTKKSKQVLIKDRVSSSSWIEECGI